MQTALWDENQHIISVNQRTSFKSLIFDFHFCFIQILFAQLLVCSLIQFLSLNLLFIVVTFPFTSCLFNGIIDFIFCWIIFKWMWSDSLHSIACLQGKIQCCSLNNLFIGCDFILHWMTYQLGVILTILSFVSLVYDVILFPQSI